MIFTKKKKVGFVVEYVGNYMNTMASTRLRAYDVIDGLRNSRFSAEFYNPKKKYDIVIFQKCFTSQFHEIAEKLKKDGIKTVLDINVNFIEIDSVLKDIQKQNNTEKDDKKGEILKMLSIVDFVLTSSEELCRMYSSYHKKVYLIEEIITDNFFKSIKTHRNNQNLPIYLTYCGYSVKLKEVLQIEGVLRELRKKYNIELLVISDHDIDLNIIPQKYIKYNQNTLPKQLSRGDIKIAPRNMDSSYNKGHSFTKPAYPLSVGLPVVASEVPSYINRGILICKNEEQWHNNLSKLIVSADERNFYGRIGSDIVKQNFSKEVIISKYIHFFNHIVL